jgi:hypothetical protein
MVWVLVSVLGLLVETWLIVVLGRRATGRYEEDREAAALAGTRLTTGAAGPPAPGTPRR